MQISIESDWQLAVSWVEPFDDAMLNGVRGAVVETTKETQDRVQAEMPVDTGWAQARWGAPEYGGIYIEENNGLTITHGSSIEPFEYIERLNEGYSSQAPAGFIDSAAASAEIMLEQRVNEVVDKMAS